MTLINYNLKFKVSHVLFPHRPLYGYLDCGRSLVRVTVIYLRYKRPREQARVYKYDIHSKSLRPEEYIWKL